MRTLIFIVSLIVAVSCNAPVETAGTSDIKQPKNVILMVGDGMGITQITAGMYANGNRLHLERCTHTGLIKTNSSDALITDSAAGATAFSIGKKTYNGAIGVDQDTVSHKTILEEMHENGYRTGLVSTSSITHATPASFYAHVPGRSQAFDIAKFMEEKTVNYFIGGGSQFFFDRNDDYPLAENLLSAGMKIDTVFDNFLNTNGEYAGHLGAPDGMPRVIDGRGDFLPEATNAIIKKLDNEAGFFLMIEGSQIDWGGHANDAEYIISEMIDFDDAVGRVLDYAEKDGETLVVITADHETGGFSIVGGTMDSLQTSFTTGYHTPIMINVFAYGPGAEEFSGIYENTMIYHKIRKLTGL